MYHRAFTVVSLSLSPSVLLSPDYRCMCLLPLRASHHRSVIALTIDLCTKTLLRLVVWKIMLANPSEPKWLWRLWLCYPLPPLGVGLLEAWDLSSANFQQKIFWKPKSTNILASVHTSCFKHVGIANLITFGSQHLQSRFAILHHSASLFQDFHRRHLYLSLCRLLFLSPSHIEEELFGGGQVHQILNVFMERLHKCHVKILEAADDPSEKQGLWYVMMMDTTITTIRL